MRGSRRVYTEQRGGIEVKERRERMKRKKKRRKEEEENRKRGEKVVLAF